MDEQLFYGRLGMFCKKKFRLERCNLYCVNW